jgi:MoaA/NifB/PqqE/SkfB family radical SAM enzyme
MPPTGSRKILQVHPTRRCNLRCRHCYSASGPEVDATTELKQLLQVTDEAAALGYDVLSVSGGEPLLYPSLREILSNAKQNRMRTTVTSNGLLLTERRLAELDGLVDVLAISLDGRPESHAAMRQSSRAFTTMRSRLGAVRASGVAFGFVFTLTMSNVAEMEYVAQFAQQHGAGLVQVHPLEAEGAAAMNLAEQVPDSRECAFAIVEAARLEQEYGLRIQVDITHRKEIQREPESFLAFSQPPEGPIGGWLSPLVLETDGTVSPLAYGFPRQFQLGTLDQASLPELADRWDREPFLDLCRRTAQRLATGERTLVNWYEEITQGAARTLVATG